METAAVRRRERRAPHQIHRVRESRRVVGGVGVQRRAHVLWYWHPGRRGGSV